ncbi:iron-sulfur cluster biosynthesis family protein [Bacillus sp. CGMCC 1.16541]|uniref:iron-sulfur cluster biosynthesis family protein n=1 Tax=Bacillus sp. CGMCC 1.16541 TaxID=2185143 RepID=UPI000D733C6A|nr:iron-sulfur cluster biosynthesis family protein [Bacillus sp. CGMCC 1.16541]
MNITFTEQAIKKINERFPEKKDELLKLKYDTDGCGCVVSGITALWVVNEADEGDVTIETNFRPVLVEKNKQVFLDENMTVDYVESVNAFMLKCPSQILNPRMALIKQIS